MIAAVPRESILARRASSPLRRGSRPGAFPVAALALALGLPLAAAAVPAAPAPPHASWTVASLSNGFAAAVYDLDRHRLTGLYPHPYGEARKGAVTPDLLWDAYFGVARGGAGTWLTASAPMDTAYENGTGILVRTREQSGLRVTERWFAPMGLAAPAVAAHLTVRNTGASPLSGLKVAFLQNFHVGPGTPEAGFASERIAWDAAGRAFVETGDTSGRAAVALPVPDADARAASPVDPYSLWASGSIGSGDGGPAQDDAISAFAWDLPDLAPGDERSVAVLLGVRDAGDAGDTSSLAAAIRAYADANPDLLATERAGWRAFHARDRLPEGLAGDSLALARQSLAMLAMSQVREPDSEGRTPHGQILASLPPGEWNRTWVRDQSYAVAALAASGHADLAADAVRFLLNGRANGYRAEVGADYAISVCRYYGEGGEESDGDPATDGPNIEFDGFGLFLWSLAEVAAREGDESLLDDAWSTASDRVADVLAGLVDPTGLIRADSSIWERHWNGRQKHFTYTDATAVLGLCAAASLGESRGDPRAGTWAAVARSIAGAMQASLVASNVLAGNLEEMPPGRALDGAVLDAFNWGVLPPDGPVAQATLDALQAGLVMDTGHGLHRNDDGDWYDRQEWVFIDLRAAIALRRAGRTAQAEALAAWVLAQSRANLDLVAELYTEGTADYAGAVPMAGFGAASWLLWLLDPVPAADVAACLAPPVPDTEGTDGADGPPDLPGPDAAEPDAALPEPSGDDHHPDAVDAAAQEDTLLDPAPDAPPGLPDTPSRKASSGCAAGFATPSVPATIAAVLLPFVAALAGRRRFLGAGRRPGVSSDPGSGGGRR